MPADPLRYVDRYDHKTKIEKIYGERWLRFVYENPVGRFATWLVFRRAFFSRYYGRRMNKPESALSIIKFIADYEINASEFAKSPFDFKSFNEFFRRALKPEARPIATGSNIAVFPADGRHLAFPDLDRTDGFYVKGAKFTLEELMDDAEIFSRVAGGSMLISRLCPSDYHRFHFPVAGIPAEAKLIGGSLYSVNPIALRRNIQFLIRNKRYVTKVDSSLFGTTAMVEVGATNVGSIVEGFVPGRPVLKGEEKGYFSFGGSCVITVFGRSRIVFDPDIVKNSAAGLETYARMGDRVGQATRG